MALFNALSRKIPGLRKRTIGEPITIIRNGRFLIENFKENASRIDMKDIATALRMQNIFSFDDIDFAQIETTGHVSVIMKEEAKKPSRFLVLRGEVLEEELKTLERSEAWLKTELLRLGLDDLEQIFLAEWVGDHLLVVTTDGVVHNSIKLHN
nr:DUF421 domain-containing protein [Asaia lannensis]